MPEITTEVAVIGAGPVGLFLANRLSQLGIRCLCLERHAKPFRHSRSIGIHPPSLRLFDEMGLADQLVPLGVKVAKGKAFSGSRLLGEISFEGCPAPHNYILAVPQYETERILESNLAPDRLRRNFLIEAVEPGATEVRLTAREGESRRTVCISASCIVGCGGRDSLVRKSAGLSFTGGPYADTFVMGDYKDTTDFGDEARIFLDVHGLVESFPLPGTMRRWVVQTTELKENPDEAEFERWVGERSGQKIAGQLDGVLSSFRVYRYLSSSFYSGRMLLAGDSAHVMSPIGGQGMNVGWLDAWDAATSLHRVLRDGASAATELAAYDAIARPRAERAIKRAEWYMSIGRQPKFPALRNHVLSMALHSPFRQKIANLVTMNAL